MQDINRFHKAFYSGKSKSSQDAFLLKYCATDTPKRKRPRNGVRGEKTVSFDYFVENMAGNKIEVCRQAFLGILGITKHRVIGVFQRFKNGESLIPVETRGGDRTGDVYKNKTDSVINFI